MASLPPSRRGGWTRDDFRRFLSLLFSNKQRPYFILNDRIEEYFRDTDFNEDNLIDYDEFLQAWKQTIKCVSVADLLLSRKLSSFAARLSDRLVRLLSSMFRMISFLVH